jgi:hypothetical protein
LVETSATRFRQGDDLYQLILNSLGNRLSIAMTYLLTAYHHFLILIHAGSYGQPAANPLG